MIKTLASSGAYMISILNICIQFIQQELFLIRNVVSSKKITADFWIILRRRGFIALILLQLLIEIIENDEYDFIGSIMFKEGRINIVINNSNSTWIYLPNNMIEGKSYLSNIYISLLFISVEMGSKRSND